MSQAEINTLITVLAGNPIAGDEISGSGGCRKIRVAGKGKGKSGGYRTITFYSGQGLPVFLITVFAKGELSNLTPKEVNGLKAITKAITQAYTTRVLRVGEAR